MKGRKLKTLVLIISLFFISSSILSRNVFFVRSWESSATGVCTEAEEQIAPSITKTSDGGTIIAWMDNRSVDYDIYAQKLDSYGNAQWTIDGVAVCSEIADQGSPRVCSDQAGGAIIVWMDWSPYPEYDLYAQRIDSTGNILWDPSGVVICNATDVQWNLDMCSDGLGGAIIVWQDYRSAVTDADIYAQRINQNGETLWNDNGTKVCDATDDQRFPKLTVTFTGRIYFTWADSRLGASDINIYSQQFNLNGTAIWPNNGYIVCNVAGEQNFPGIISSGSGIIVTWTDLRDDPLGDIYAQRLDYSGVLEWGLGLGIPICNANDSQYNAQICSDMASGAIIVWTDKRTNSQNDIYAQRINWTGDALWTPNGTAVCTAINDQSGAMIISDGASGAMIVWSDNRNPSYWLLYGQRILANGTNIWTDGLAVDSSIGCDQFSQRLVLTEPGIAIVTWDDDRSGGKRDIWAEYFIDEENPTSNSPADSVYEEGEIGIIQWILSDNAGGGYYRVKINGTDYIPWTEWDIGENLQVPINTTVVGIWEYTIEYYDAKGFMGIPDTVSIRITEKPSEGSPKIFGYDLLLIISCLLLGILILKMKIKKK
ncbi:MAG: hypothetical protein ACFFBC_13700 [Promethearchaeota archaeon]